jgi:hypothetical protein
MTIKQKGEAAADGVCVALPRSQLSQCKMHLAHLPRPILLVLPSGLWAGHT